MQYRIESSIDEICVMKYVIALGGNALEKGNLAKVADAIVKLANAENKVVVTHGNGPQVGALAEHSNKPLSLLTAQTESEIGLMIENAIATVGKSKSNVVLTRVIVNKEDRAFDNPLKPIGKFLSVVETQEMRKKGFVVKRLIKGYRRVVASPRPREIYDILEIIKLINKDRIVICCGGGGIVVVRKGYVLDYVDAVIDKDYTSALLAEKINADRLIILTNVDGAYVNYSKKNQKLIEKTSVNEMFAHLSNGEFESGSMEPKIRACLDYLMKTTGVAAIGNIDSPANAMALKKCTVIKKK